MSEKSDVEAPAMKRRRKLPPMRLHWPGGDDHISTTVEVSSFGTSETKEKIRGNRKSSNTNSMHISSSLSKTNKPSRQREEQLWIDKYAPKCTNELCVAPKKITEVEVWLKDTSECKLLILIGSPGIGKSTMIKVIAQNLNMNVLEWTDNTHTDHISWNSDKSFGYEGQTAAFRDFLDTAVFQYNSVKDGDECSGSIVLIDEVPYMHNPKKEAEFRVVMTTYLMKTQVPTVFIFSNVYEGKHKPEDLERYIDTKLLYSPFVKILQINAVTKPKMKSCLKNIMKKERISSTIISAMDKYIEELHSTSEGDIRHAIMQLQFRLKSHTRSKSPDLLNFSHRDTKFSTFHALGKLLYAKRIQEHEMDPSLGKEVSFHECAWNTDRRPPLQFVPEQILDHSDITIDGALSFLQNHSSDFFSDISDLSTALDLFSDASYLLSTCSVEQRDSNYPNSYATSLCSRSVAYSNKNPAPLRFRQLNAPPIYDVFRKRRENQTKYEQVCKRVSRFDCQLMLDINVRDNAEFASDFLPYMKILIPHEVSAALGDVYSNYSSHLTLSGGSVGNDTDVSVERRENSSRNILEYDDIEDSDDEAPSNDLISPKKRQSPVRKSEPEVIVIDSDSD
jgi:cell cycle checkpoint protein